MSSLVISQLVVIFTTDRFSTRWVCGVVCAGALIVIAIAIAQFRKLVRSKTDESTS
ncbi:hypothetical protein ABIB56_001508 [Glaciihabitans sp. UYNi722]